MDVSGHDNIDIGRYYTNRVFSDRTRVAHDWRLHSFMNNQPDHPRYKHTTDHHERVNTLFRSEQRAAAKPPESLHDRNMHNRWKQDFLLLRNRLSYIAQITFVRFRYHAMDPTRLNSSRVCIDGQSKGPLHCKSDKSDTPF